MYYIIIAFQGFCIYHILKTKNDYYWIFLILFIPVIGSLIYLFKFVYNQRDMDRVQDGIAKVINPTKKIADLKKKVEFSDTFQNKLNLADAYFDLKDYDNAIRYYKKSKSHLFSIDSYLSSRLMEAYFHKEDHANVLKCYKDLENGKEKIKGYSQVQYGLTLAALGKPKSAEKALRKVNISFSNYEERLILAEFLIEKDETAEAKEILTEILDESIHFTKANARNYKQTVSDIKMVLRDIS